MYDSNHRVYEAWKKLRNYLYKFDRQDSLAAIRWYFARQQSYTKHDIPSDLTPHPSTDEPGALLPFDLETLAREVIVCSRDTIAPRHSMRNPNHLAKAMGLMKDIENVIAGEYISNSTVMQEFYVRMAHRQFKYQTGRPSYARMVRFSRIFSDHRVEKYVIAKTNLTTKQIYTIGSALWSSFLNYFIIKEGKLTSDIPGISQSDVQNFLKHFSVPMDDLKEILLSPQKRKMNENFFYTYETQLAYPLIRVEVNGTSSVICPLPTLLVWRFTSGLYYDLYMEKDAGVDFGSNFGLAYESYIGDVLDSSLSNSNFTIFPGEPNLKDSPKRCDWIIDSTDEAIFLEVKTKRLSMAAKTSLLSSTDILEQLETLGSAVVQAYQSYIAYKDGLYKEPVYTYSVGKKYFIGVVTLEDWHLMGDSIDNLKLIVERRLSENNIDPSVTDYVPYIIMSTEDIEHFTFLLKNHSVSSIIEPYADSSSVGYNGYEFGVYAKERFKEDLNNYEYVFNDNDQDVFTAPLPKKGVGNSATTS